MEAFVVLPGKHQATGVPVKLKVADIGAGRGPVEDLKKRLVAQAGQARDFVGQAFAVDVALLLPVLRQGEVVGVPAYDEQLVHVQQRVG